MFGRGRIGDVPEAGVTIGVSNPVVALCWVPDCGCDACDSGSLNEIERVDEWMTGIVLGTFRRLVRSDRHLTVINDNAQGTSGLRRWETPEKILANPKGWTEIRGSSWL